MANPLLESVGHLFQAKTSNGAQQAANAGKAGKRGGEADARGDRGAWRRGKTAFVN